MCIHILINALRESSKRLFSQLTSLTCTISTLCLESSLIIFEPLSQVHFGSNTDCTRHSINIVFDLVIDTVLGTSFITGITEKNK